MCESNTLSEKTTSAFVTQLIKQEVFNRFRTEVAQFEERWRKSVSKLTQSIELYNYNNNIVLNNSKNKNNEIDTKIKNQTENKTESFVSLDDKNEKSNKNNNINENILDKNKLNFFIVENNLTDLVELQPVVLKTSVSETVGKNIEYIKKLQQKRLQRQKQEKLYTNQEDIGLEEYVLKNIKKYELFKRNKHKNKIYKGNLSPNLNKEFIKNIDQQSHEQPVQHFITAIEKPKHVSFLTDKGALKITKHPKKLSKIDKIYNNHDNKKIFVKNNIKAAERDITDLENKYSDKLKGNNSISNDYNAYSNKSYKKFKTGFCEFVKDQVEIRKMLKDKLKKTEKHLCNTDDSCIRSETGTLSQKLNQSKFGANNKKLFNNKQKKPKTPNIQEHNCNLEYSTDGQAKNINLDQQKLFKREERKNNTSNSVETPKKENMKLNFNISVNSKIKIEKPQRKLKHKKITKKKKIAQVIKKKQKKELRYFSPYMKQLDVFNNKSKHPKLIKLLYHKYREAMKNKQEDMKKCLHSRNEISPRLSSVPTNKIVGVPLQPFTQELETHIKSVGNSQLENFYNANSNKLGGLYFLVSSLIFRNDNNIINFDLNSEFNDHKLGKPVWLDPDPRPNGFGPLKPRPHATYRRISRPRPPPQEYVLFFGDPNVNLYTVEAI